MIPTKYSFLSFSGKHSKMIDTKGGVRELNRDEVNTYPQKLPADRPSLLNRNEK